MNQTKRILTPRSYGIIRRVPSSLPFICIMVAFLTAGLLASLPAHAALTLTTSADRDTFVIFSSGETGLGARGAMQIAAPTASQPVTEEAVFSFNTASLKSQFDDYYGVGKWVVSHASVTCYSNWNTAGVQPNNPRFNIIAAGLFSFNWLSNDSWDEGTLMYHNLADYLPGTGNNNLMQTLGTYYYFADGTTPVNWVLANTSGLIGDILSGGEITIFGTPADNVVSNLINTSTHGDPPVLSVTVEAAPVPVPAAAWLLGSGLAGLGFLRRRAGQGFRASRVLKTTSEGGCK